MVESLYGITREEKGKKHIYLLPGQKLDDGELVNPTFRVQCDRSIKDASEKNTIWRFDKSTVEKSSKGTHYIARGSKMGNVMVLDTMKTICQIPSKDDSTVVDCIFAVAVSISRPSGFYVGGREGEIAYYSEDMSCRPILVDDSYIEPDLFPTGGGKTKKGVLEDLLFGSSGYKKEIFGFETLEEYEKLKAKKSRRRTRKTTATPGESGEETMPTPTWIETIFEDSTLKCPTAKGDGFYMSDEKWKLLIRNIKRHVNTLIVGPAGTGKTSCISQAASRLGLPLYIFDMGAMIDPISSLLGVHRLKDGHSVFDYAQFTKVIQEPCIILLDELNRAPMGAGNILFPCLDDRRTLPIEIASGDGVRDIKIHPEVTFIATANIGSEYTGTSVLDRALVNRFFPLELSHLSEKVEMEVLQTRTGVTKEESDMIVKVANTLRGMNKKMEISMAVSVRETLMISNLVKDGWGLGDAMKAVYLPLYEGTDSEGERSKILKVLASY